jgi:Lactoylglutathione lyase and related lyases
MLIKNLHHVCIQTGNYQESLKFYTKILGFEITSETKDFHDRDYNTWLKYGDIMIELQTAKKGGKLADWSSDNSGPVHMCFLVEDLKKEYEGLKSMGYSNFKMKNGQEIYKVENGYLFKIKAPEGTEIEVRDNPEL